MSTELTQQITRKIEISTRVIVVEGIYGEKSGGS